MNENYKMTRNGEKGSEKRGQKKKRKHFSLKGALELERRINKNPRKF